MSDTPQWKNGTSSAGGYDRYGSGPYYDVPDGLKILAEHDWAGAYEFDMIVIWQSEETGELRAATDSGCSCPTPFADLTWDAMLPIGAPDDLQPLFGEDGVYSVKWDAQDEGIAKLKAAVHRAVREAS